MDSAADSGSVPALMDFVRVPNTSPLFDPDWATAQNIAGFAYEVIASPQEPDLILVEVQASAPGLPTVLM